MKKIADFFHLEPNNEFVDESGQTHVLAGSLEVKGLLGYDKRRYILDSMRLSPRDANYPGEENNCCVIRLEMIENYIMSKHLEGATLKMKQYKET